MQANNFGGTFDQLFFWIFCDIFTEDASLLLLHHGAKSQKWPKTQIKGSCLCAHQAPCVLQWIPFLMFETSNSCRRKLVCAKIMLNVGKNLSWCALLPTFKKNQKRKLLSSQIRLVPFPHLRGQLWGVTTSQIDSLLSIFWHVSLHRWGTMAYR